MPPPDVVMILLPLKENAATRPGRRPASPVGRAQRLGGVLDERDVVALADPVEAVVVAALAVQVDGEHGRDAGAAGGATRARSSSRAGSMVQLPASQSTKTGEAPV